MRDLTKLDNFRMRTPQVLKRYGSYGDETCGAFLIPLPGQSRILKCLASNSEGWDHVSVSVDGHQRTPTWGEMAFVKTVFFKMDEIAWEYHMNVSDHINDHPFVLHIWRKHDFTMPLPPKVFV